MADPTGGPPVARGDAVIVPSAPRTKRRGNPNTERTRDMDKVRKLKAEADRDAREAEARHLADAVEPVAVLPGDETTPCRMTHFTDPTAKKVVYEVFRRDLRLSSDHAATLTWSFEEFNAMVKSLGQQGAADNVLDCVRAKDRDILANMNLSRRRHGLPKLRHSVHQWQAPLVLAEPPMSQATKKREWTARITQEMSQDSPNIQEWQANMMARELGLISDNEAKKRLQNITDA